MGRASVRTAKPARTADERVQGVTPQTIEPMEARAEDALPEGPGWQFEPKWDGFRCIAFRDGDAVDLRAKSGKPLARYFPDVVERLATLAGRRFVVDGELAIAVGETLSFDALQQRLHPAESRVRKLARETPAIYILFDILASPDGRVLVEHPLRERREALEAFIADAGDTDLLRLSPTTRARAEAERWLARTGGALDGVVAKPLDGNYEPGERAMVKVKRLRTADCVVAGFRYRKDSQQVGSLLLGLCGDDGLLHHVGFTSTIAERDRAAVTERLEALRGSGFTGRAPGGPSRWSTERSGEWQPLAPELVAEVRYDHVTGDRFRHGTKLMRWRPDKSPRQCTFDQLGREARPAKLITAMLAGR